MAILEKTDLDFAQSVENNFCVVDLYGEFCAPCKMLSAVIERVEAEIPFVDFIKVNTTRNPGVSELFHVEAVPTLLIMRDGQVLYRHLGYMDEQELLEMIGKYIYC